jgi:hypothetical protein
VIRHVAVLTWREGTSDRDVAAVHDALTALPALIPQLRGYWFGSDIGLDDGNAHFVVIAELDSPEDYGTYRDHPAHRAVLEELIRPILAGRSALQYEV